MSGLVDALMIVAVAGLVVFRQFRAHRIDTDRRWWVVPVVLGVIAVREPGMIDAHHHVASVLLLAAELCIGVATGVGWAWTTRVWVAADGAVWSRGSRASVAVWTAGIALRAALFAAGAALGVRQDTSALLLALAVTLLARSGILARRAQAAGRAATTGAATGAATDATHGDALPRLTRKEPA
ncbi:DUF1453 family protein [Streptomyces sp. SID5910]|uniref:DUF1453 family protein n=1 Tax=Streptomyces sp. SID5910 TaxID=2690312 RepID=UPI00136CE7A2|nr:DUF1453 family protein [Streptomyces sp. SID5910]MYR45472.1 DUF1453 family protein [Streptomyces sp. SID5910]